MLLSAGKSAEARAEFERSLSGAPNRALSLLGLARSAAKAGDHAASEDAYRRLAAVWRHADPDLPEVAEVRRSASPIAARLTVAPRLRGICALRAAPASGSAGCGLDRSPDPGQTLRSRGARLLPSVTSGDSSRRDRGRWHDRGGDHRTSTGRIYGSVEGAVVGSGTAGAPPGARFLKARHQRAAPRPRRQHASQSAFPPKRARICSPAQGPS